MAEPNAEGTPSKGGDDGSGSKGLKGRTGKSVLSDSEFELIKQEEKVHTSVPEDTWGVAIVVLVKDFGDILQGENWTKAQMMQFIIGLCTLAINVIVQVMMLGWVKKYVVDVATHDTQYNYANYHAHMFTTDGKFDNDKWANFNGKGPLCDSALSKKTFLLVVLLLWGLKVAAELRRTYELFRNVRNLHPLPKEAGPGDMVLESRQEDNSLSFEIVALTRTARYGIYLFVVFPKFAIAILLLTRGVTWLTATDSFYALIMNALALGFIMEIDEVFYNAVFPPTVQKVIQRTQIANKKPATNPMHDPRLILGEYLIGFLTIGSLIGALLLYLETGQTVLPNYKWDIGSHCNDYVAFSMSKVCVPGSVCFPFGASDASGFGASEGPGL